MVPFTLWVIKYKLNKLISDSDILLHEGEVLIISQELDKQIVSTYMKERVEENKKLASGF
jgi:hypothetical protein